MMAGRQELWRSTLVGCVIGLAWLAAPTSSARGALMAGDVAIIGVNSDNPDEFAWVPLRSFIGGQVIYFSDAGWINGGFSGTSSDGGLRFTAPAAGLAAGAIQVATTANLTPEYERVTGALGRSFSLSPSGDQLVSFSGSIENPTFLFAVNFAASEWTLSGSGSNSIRSGLYPGLINGRSAVAVGAGPRAGDEFDNLRYEGITAGTGGELLNAVSDSRFWRGRNAAGSSDRFADLTNGVGAFELQENVPTPAPPAEASVPEPQSLAIWGLAAVALWVRRVARNRGKPGWLAGRIV